MEIVEVSSYSDRVLSALNRLMPQLSQDFEAMSKVGLETIIRSESTILFMAREGEDYIGSVTLVIFKIPSGLRAWVEDVVVGEHYRGKGVGTMLVSHAVAVAEQAKVTSIDLTVRSTRVPAMSLYKKLGFADRETNVFRYQG